MFEKRLDPHNALGYLSSILWLRRQNLSFANLIWTKFGLTEILILLSLFLQGAPYIYTNLNSGSAAAKSPKGEKVKS